MTLAAAATYILIAVWPIGGAWVERQEAATTRQSCEVAARAAVHCPKCKPLDVDGPAREAHCVPGDLFNPGWNCITGFGCDG